MKNVAIVVGALLITVGLFGYGLPDTKEIDEATGETIAAKSSPTALIPVAFGLPILLCGFWALAKPSATKFAMHVAVTFGLLGAMASTGRATASLLGWIRGGGEFNQRSFAFVAIMAVLCWMFVIFCVGSFIKARKARVGSQK